MDDDIDIEEHNLLDHPRIKNIFPDISSIKCEVPSDEEVNECEDYLQYDFNTTEDTHTYFNGDVDFNSPEDAQADADNDGDLDALQETHAASNGDLSAPGGAHADPNGVDFNSPGGTDTDTYEDIGFNTPGNTKPINDNGDFNSSRNITADSSDDIFFVSPEDGQASTNYEDDIGSQLVIHHSSLYDENDYYPLNNKIILGNKPMQDDSSSSEYSSNDESIDLDNVDLHPKLVLEDWGPQLQRSSCYCRQCETLFATENALDYHKMMTHSLLVALDVHSRNKAIKSTAKPVVIQPIITTQKNKEVIKMKCKICNTVFANRSNLYRHNKTVHKSNLYSLSQSEKSDTDDCVVQPQSSNRSPDKAPLNISESVTFEPRNGDTFYRCNICTFIYKLNSFVQRHFEAKHKHKAVNVSPLIYDRAVKFKCAFCNFAFKSCIVHNKHLIRRHMEDMKQKKSTKPFEECVYKRLKCKKTFVTRNLAVKHIATEHSKIKHKMLLGKVAKAKKNIRKIGATSKTKVKQGSLNAPISKSSIFKCISCQIHYLSFLSAVQHYYTCSLCKNIEIWRCKRCRRRFRKCDRARHELQHTTTNKFKVFMAQPQMTKRILSRCPDCGLCFTEHMFWKHWFQGCDGKKPGMAVHCEKCNMDIHATAIKLHNLYHSQKLKREDFIVIDFIPMSEILRSQNGIKRKTKRSESQLTNSPKKGKLQNKMKTYLPELIKKYESLQKMWNLLYRCDVCDTVTDSYDRAVEHCQNHYNNLENYNVIIKECKFCDIKLDSDCYNRHNQLHIANKAINRGLFKILKYSYTSLLKDDWFDLFGTLSQDQIQQILNRSIYNTVRGIKMCLVSHGSPDFTLYMCTSCKTFVDLPSLEKHARNKEECSKMMKRYYCSICRIPFLSEKSKIKHEIIHKTPGFSTDTFRVVSFNAVQDRRYNDAIFDYAKQEKSKVKGHNSKSVVKKYSILKNYSKRDKKSIEKKETQIVKLYKCRCDLHFTSPRNIEKHLSVCGTAEVPTESCSKCGLMFATDVLVSHLCSHHTSNKRTEFEVIQYPMKILLYQCEVCQTVFKEKLAVDKHVANCTGRNIGSKCKFCDLVVNNNDTNWHHMDHQRKLKSDDFTIQVVKKITASPVKKSLTNLLFKCSKCDIYYLTNKSLNGHYNLKHRIKGLVKKCALCSLRFPVKTFRKHLKVHHNRGSDDDLSSCIEEYDITDSTVEAEMAKVKKAILHKCLQCNSHFVSTDSLKAHKCNEILVNCDTCQLNFSEESLKWHNILHHTVNKYTIEDFEIETHANEGGVDSSNSDFSIKQTENEATSDSITDKTNDIDVSELTTLDKSIETSLTIVNNANNATKRKITLYKCGECNVFYVAQSTCYKHTYKNHKPLNSKDYIECKFCALQFTVATLTKHLMMHHSSVLRLEDVFIEEYTPQNGGGVKIEFYYLKNQSTLVSTTTDVGKDIEMADASRTLNSTPDADFSKINERLEESTEQTRTVTNDGGDAIDVSYSQITPKIENSFETGTNVVELTSDVTAGSNKNSLGNELTMRIVDKEEFHNDIQNPLENIDVSINDSNKSRDLELTDMNKISNDECDLPELKHISNNLKENSINNNLDEVNKTLPVVCDSKVDDKKNIASDTVVIDDNKEFFLCNFCPKKYKTKKAKDFHESLDHKDSDKECPICGRKFNVLILNELHLELKDDEVTCCICSDTVRVSELVQHSERHRKESEARP